MIWDGDATWEVEIVYTPDHAKGAESRLKDALASFTLLRAKAE